MTADAKKTLMFALAGYLLIELSGLSVLAFGVAESDSGLGHGAGFEEMVLPEVRAVALSAGESLTVVASTSIVAEVVGRVGGDAVELTVLIGPGQDPHSYEPTPRALVGVRKAHIVFVNGLRLEEGLLDSISQTAVGPVVPVSAGIEPIETRGERGAGHSAETDHGPDGRNSHVWMDPANVMVWVDNIERVLSAADPVNSESYRANADMYLAQLRELDAGIRQKAGGIPAAKRKLVTDHHALDYFAEKYGFQVVGVILPSVSTAAETSASRTAQLVELLRREGVSTIFVDAAAGRTIRSLTRAVAKELGTGVRVVPLLIGSLAPKGRRGDSYLELMEYNLDQIVSGLNR